jgi:hypothetical protein
MSHAGWLRNVKIVTIVSGVGSSIPGVAIVMVASAREEGLSNRGALEGGISLERNE